MKKIAFIPSNNGMGHFRRLESICQHLSIEEFEISFFLDERLEKERDFSCRFKKHDVKFIKTPLEFDGPSVKREVDFSWLNLQKELESFDVVVCDTVTWPAIVVENVILIAQFLWEFYYMRHASTESKQKLREHINQINQSTRHFGMKTFVWNEMESIFETHELPVWDYWDLRKASVAVNQEIAYSLSGALDISTDMLNDGFEYSKFVRIRGLEHYISEKGMRPKGVVCRAGVGIVSECISAKSVPIFVSSEDTEIQFNMNRVLEMGLGIELKNLMILDPKKRNLFLNEFSRNLNWPDVVSSEEVCNILLEREESHGYA